MNDTLTATKETIHKIEFTGQICEDAIRVRDEQTDSMSKLLADFQRLEGKQAVLSQKLATAEAATVTQRSRLEEVNNDLRELEGTCMKQNDMSAGN